MNLQQFLFDWAYEHHISHADQQLIETIRGLDKQNRELREELLTCKEQLAALARHQCPDPHALAPSPDSTAKEPVELVVKFARPQRPSPESVRKAEEILEAQAARDEARKREALEFLRSVYEIEVIESVDESLGEPLVIAGFEPPATDRQRYTLIRHLTHRGPRLGTRIKVWVGYEGSYYRRVRMVVRIWSIPRSQEAMVAG